MTNLSTFPHMQELMKKRLLKKKMPEGWEESVDNYMNNKAELIKKEDSNYSNTSDLTLFKNAELIYHFLTKDSLEAYSLPKSMYPKGIIKEGLVIMPISTYQYVYNWCGIKGISTLSRDPLDPKKDIWFLDVEGEMIKIDGKPIERFAYTLPDSEGIKSWAGNTHDYHSSQEIFQKVEKYFRFFLDVPEYAYKVLTYGVFCSWLQEILDAVFYIGILGAWGGGKTTILELLGLICRNGVVGQPSKAFIARMIDQQSISILFDELDSVINTDDSELLSLIREGYRKGSLYPVMGTDLEPKFFLVYGFKAFTIKTQAEGALLQRSLPITTVESTESTLPELNLEKRNFSILLLNDIYRWYLDNIIYIVDSVRCVDYKSIDIYSGEKNREDVHKVVCSYRRATEATGQRRGRNAELASVLLKISNLMGVDFDNPWATELFDIKKDIEEEHHNIGPEAQLRELLAHFYKKLAPETNEAGYRTTEGFVKVAHKYVWEEFQKQMKNEKEYGVTPKSFAGFLREMGFDAGNSKRKLRCRIPGEIMGSDGWPSRLALIFTPQILLKLGLKEIEATKEVKEEKI